MRETSLRHFPAAATAEVLTGERCFIVELINDPALPTVSLARARVEPGIVTAFHVLATEEIYIVERGGGRMEGGDGQSFDVGPGDAVRIPAGAPQRIVNTGADDLVFLCLCLPRFTEAAYADLDGGGG